MNGAVLYVLPGVHVSFPTAKGGRNEHEETINHDFYHCIFYNQFCFFASAEETDLSEPVQQTEEAANDQGQQETEAAKTTEEPASHLVSLGVFKTTGYCPCRHCSAGWGRSTSTGAVASSRHTIAVDPRVIPYGTQVMINGVVYTAEDKGGGVRGHHIDIFFDTHTETRQHGVQNAEVFLLTA